MKLLIWESKNPLFKEKANNCAISKEQEPMDDSWMLKCLNLKKLSGMFVCLSCFRVLLGVEKGRGSRA